MSAVSGQLRALRLRILRRALGLLDRRRRRILAWRALEGQEVRSITFEREGIVWNAGVEMMGFHLFTENGYQGAEIAALLAWMRRHSILNESRDVFVDVGANIGTTCIPIALATGCRAVAIEPIEANFALLVRNVEANGLHGRVMPVKKAVLRAPAKVQMALMRHNSGGHHVRRDGGNDTSYPAEDLEDVAADGLLAILESVGVRLEEVALVWADVQGCESEVIESAAPLWRAGVPLWSEIEPGSLSRQRALAEFAGLAATHFDRFLTSSDLRIYADRAVVRPIASLTSLLAEKAPDFTTDVLLLPPSLSLR